MYVWILVLLISAFVEPALRLIETLPAYKQLRAKISAKCSPPAEKTEQTLEQCVEQTLAATFEIQENLSGIFLGFLTALLFGIAAPVLPLVALLGSWLNFCSLVWVSRAEQDVSFGQLLAATVLVQPPITAVQIMAMGIVVLLSVFIFVDMSFDAGPTALYAVFNSIVIPLSFVRSQMWIQMCCKINNFLERIILAWIQPGGGVSGEGCRDGEEAMDEVVIERNAIHANGAVDNATSELYIKGVLGPCMVLSNGFDFVPNVSPDLSSSCY